MKFLVLFAAVAFAQVYHYDYLEVWEGENPKNKSEHASFIENGDLYIEEETHETRYRREGTANMNTPRGQEQLVVNEESSEYRSQRHRDGTHEFASSDYKEFIDQGGEKHFRAEHIGGIERERRDERGEFGEQKGGIDRDGRFGNFENFVFNKGNSDHGQQDNLYKMWIDDDFIEQNSTTNFTRLGDGVLETSEEGVMLIKRSDGSFERREFKRNEQWTPRENAKVKSTNTKKEHQEHHKKSFVTPSHVARLGRRRSFQHMMKAFEEMRHKKKEE